jgi:flagellar basal body rod protein FlgG
MDYGLYLSAAGAQTATYRQDVLANNLANMNTVGFKPDFVINRERLPERLERSGSFAEPKHLLERLGGGLLLEPTGIDLSQGSLEDTGNDLDLAIEGDGLFVVSDGRSNAPEDLRLTRDGRFTVGADGALVMAANGMQVLDRTNRPVQLDPNATVNVDANGTVSQNGRAVAQLQIVSVDSADLAKVGENLLRLADGVVPTRTPASGRVQQGYIETSAVDPISTLNDMIKATKAANGNMKMIQYHDFALGQVMNTFARVS